MGITFGEMTDRLARRLNDQAHTAYSLDEKEDAINESMREVEMLARCNPAVVTAAAVAGQSDYPAVDGSNRIFELLEVSFDGTLLRRVASPGALAVGNEAHNGEGQGVPTHWHPGGMGAILYPTPGAEEAGKQIVIRGYGVQADLSDPADTADGIPEPFCECAILDRAEAKLRLRRPTVANNPAVATALLSVADRWVTAIVDAIRSR